MTSLLYSCLHKHDHQPIKNTNYIKNVFENVHTKQGQHIGYVYMFLSFNVSFLPFFVHQKLLYQHMFQQYHVSFSILFGLSFYSKKYRHRSFLGSSHVIFSLTSENKSCNRFILNILMIFFLFKLIYGEKHQ